MHYQERRSRASITEFEVARQKGLYVMLNFSVAKKKQHNFFLLSVHKVLYGIQGSIVG